MAVTATLRETLHIDDRKDFSLAHANPFSNLWLLVCHGSGLRHLTASTLCSFCAGSSLRSILGSFRFGPLGFTPAVAARFEQGMAVPGVLTQRFFSGRSLRWRGNLPAYELSALLGAGASRSLAASCRPLSVGQW